MRRLSRTGGRLRIGRLDLDLRGVAPATAEAAARALGPALARALTSRSPDEGFGIRDSGFETRDSGLGTRDSRFRSADRIDAGRIESPASPDAHDLAARLAQRIAQALEREER
jgi:hypothetical protein